MTVPNLLKADIEAQIPDCKVIGVYKDGGQKRVFPCKLSDGKIYALKFLAFKANIAEFVNISISNFTEDVSARARREVNIMRKCLSPYIIKLGPIDLNYFYRNNEIIIYFSEEWIEGNSVEEEIKNNTLNEFCICNIGINIAHAIDELWGNKHVHRDIKPNNIMHCRKTNNFVLLDMGLAFDICGNSLTIDEFAPGTLAYQSPEQLDFKNKRLLDFRSDLFSLGVVLYEAATSKHPFIDRVMLKSKVRDNIRNKLVVAPSDINPKISPELDSIILRLLEKEPHMRYRKCGFLIEELQELISKRR